MSFRTRQTLSCLSAAAVVTAFALVACEDGSSAGPSPTPDGGAGFDGGAGPEGGEVVNECPAPTAGPTEHKGDVKGDEVWTAAGSPHILDYNVSVRDGASLVIEPCAEVQLAKGVRIQVAYPGTPNIGGALVAVGTAKHPITFKGKGGERWASIYASAPGTVRLAYVTLEGGGGGDFEHGATLNMLGKSEMPADPMLHVDHVTVKGSLGTGVFMQRHAKFISDSHDLVITGSGNEEAPFPMEIEEHAIDSLPTGVYTGNKTDEILLERVGAGTAGQGLLVDATLHERGVPYRMGASKNADFVIGGGEKGQVATLTIEPGVTMKFVEGSAFEIQHFTNLEPSTGAVHAVGTPAKPIVFTSASPNPKAGDWRGLWFGGIPQATNRLENVRIEYAGYDCGCILLTCSDIAQHEGAVIFTAQPPSAFIKNTVFKEIAGHGVTQGFDGTLVNFRASNTFEGVTGCVQTRPRSVDTSCPDPRPTCD